MTWVETYALWTLFPNVGYRHQPTITTNKWPQTHHKTHLPTWQQVVTMWHICNTHLYPTSAHNANCSRHRETLQQILHEAQQHLHLAAMIGHIDIEQLMTKPTKSIQQFITRSHDHIRDHNRAAAKWAWYTHDIWSYFQQQAPTLTATAI